MATEKDMEITPAPALESRTNGKSEYRREDASVELSNQFLDVYHKIDDKVPIFGTSHGVHNGFANLNETHDELTQLLMELTFQNDYLKAQIGATQSQVQQTEVSREESGSGQDGVASEQVNHLNEMVKCLNKEIQEQKETQKAAENALQHLRVAYSEADGKVQELSMKLVEAQHKMEQEIQERDDKYVELDSKFGRLHKRAKQRIQEIQKEKDDLEAQHHDVIMKAEQASNQQTLAQQELERTRQQTSEALRSMDVERQQLRAANNKLRENIDEMHHSLEAKANALEGLQQAVSEKERMLEETRRSLEIVEEKRQSTLVDLSAKHQKQLESLENQLADALSERSKAAEMISSLEMLLVEKDSNIVKSEAALTSEAVRFEAALEEMRGELIHLNDKHEKEIQSWEAACQALRSKLEASESACLRSEFEAAKMRSRLELDVSNQNHLLDTKEAELVAAKDEISRLESEFSAYKVRAHALLLKKDAELSAAKDSDLLRAQEEAVKEAERVAAVAIAERDKVIQNLHDVLANHDKEDAHRHAALSDAEQRLRSITMKLESTTTQHLSEKEAWQRNVESIEENWRLKYGMLEAQKIVHIGDGLQKDLEALRLRYEKLKEEHESFRDIADRTIEDKEKEIGKLLEDNKNLHRSIDLKSNVDHIDKQSTASLKHDAQNLSIAVAEQQILLLARKQAQREEELAQSQRHILALHDEIEELERENRLHSQQEAMLKAELRSVERSQKREGVDMTYLKNVILKLLETGEVEALLPVIGTLLQFSPEEVRKCQQAYHTSDVASTPSSASAGDALSTPRSVFSRFSF